MLIWYGAGKVNLSHDFHGYLICQIYNFFFNLSCALGFGQTSLMISFAIFKFHQLMKMHPLQQSQEDQLKQIKLEMHQL